MEKIILVLIIFYSSNVIAQTNDSIWIKRKIYSKERRIEVRKSNDSFYHGRDTLYLLYDKTDTLQFKYSKDFIWFIRFPTEEEKEKIYDGGHDSSIGFKIRFRFRNKKLVNFRQEEVDKLNPATRKEFMDFYSRELKRTSEEFKKTGDHRVAIVLSYWPLSNYFEKLYILEKLEGDKYNIYEIY